MREQVISAPYQDAHYSKARNATSDVILIDIVLPQPKSPTKTGRQLRKRSHIKPNGKRG